MCAVINYALSLTPNAAILALNTSRVEGGDGRTDCIPPSLPPNQLAFRSKMESKWPLGEVGTLGIGWHHGQTVLLNLLLVHTMPVCSPPMVLSLPFFAVKWGKEAKNAEVYG